MERGAPHLVDVVQTGIDNRLRALAAFGEPRPAYVPDTTLVGLAITRIVTSRGYSGYTNDHAEHLDQLRRRWGRDLMTPYIESGTGVGESLTLGVPVYDREHTRYGELTQNVGRRAPTTN